MSIQPESTTINHLPEEMFRNVFNYLSKDDIVNCSKVCVYWKNLVEGLGECFWIKKYSREYPDVFQDGQRTSGLSMRQLCRSLLRWDDINKFQNFSYAQHMPHENMGTVCLLENNIISYPIRRLRRCDRCDREWFETTFYAVVYFDWKKREIVNTREFGVNFRNYRESDDIIVIEIVQGNQHTLRVLTKRCDTEVTEQVIFNFMEECSWFVVSNDVYYQTKEDKVIKLHRLRVIRENGGLRFENTALAESNKHEILAIAPFGTTIQLLRRRSNCWMYVVTLKENALKYIIGFYYTIMEPKRLFKEFVRFGFYPSNSDVNRQILKLSQRRTGYPPEAVIVYGPYTMRFYLTCHRKISESWVLNINVAPTGVSSRSQCLKFEIQTNTAPVISEIELIQIIESATGHIIFIEYLGYKLFESEKCRRLILIYIDHNVTSWGRRFDSEELCQSEYYI